MLRISSILLSLLLTAAWYGYKYLKYGSVNSDKKILIRSDMLMETDDNAKIFHWKNLPRRFFLSDPFFEDGNVALNKIHADHVVLNDNPASSDEEIESCETFLCHANGCMKSFTSINNYELHYHSAHEQMCLECRRILPSQHLLDLHIEENHDPFFVLVKDRRPSYRCLVSCCTEMFSDESSRKDHLVIKHKYPANFRFNRPAKKSKKKKPFNSNKMNSKENKKPSCSEKAEESMQTEDIKCDSQKEPNLIIKNSKQQRIPRSVCFGQGSMKSFQSNNFKKPWHQRKGKEKPPESKIADVDMNDLMDALQPDT